ncbi:hypothetical protein GCM10011581_20380 [Saccharopolyspora subtropica]|uniref:Uncharacterized protein n=1 Tax=Saccharopolyspora thermophila TaxID=89367 RepID=A0A917JSY2_9PSEU|nr:hypothetical protein [Saccharopolyspora subtropica]GGI83035.1 hypothetical protein GCM10011581_20380 [Saccharopolyspora subtropica]
MAISTQITEPTPRLDWFAEPLAAIASLFAAPLPNPDENRPEARRTPEASADRLPPPTGELPHRPHLAPGEPVDTSQARPAQAPAASAGAAPSPE